MEISQMKANRNHGIDLLRVILSFCVITIHVLYYGGFRTHADPSNPGFFILWFMGVAINCTVNCFAIMSGFLLYDRPVRYTGVFRLLLAILFHGILITILFWLFAPSTVTKEHWLQAFLPISENQFWYFTSYFGAFFFFPVLSNGMRLLSKKQANLLIISMIVVFSVLPTLTGSDPFRLNLGYSVLWLMVLFCIGAYLKRFEGTLLHSKQVLILIWAGCILITGVDAVFSALYPDSDRISLLDYTSPTVVVSAIAVVQLFASIQIPKWLQKVSGILALSTFGIYLLHEHPLVRQNLILDKFVSVLALPVINQLLAVFAIVIVIWSACFILEFARQRIFHFLRIDALLKK